MADSGFFLETDSGHLAGRVGGGAVQPGGVASRSSNNSGLVPGAYASGMRAMVAMSNATAGLSRACVTAAGAEVGGAGEAWRCVFAQEAALHLATPTFALQSA